jgi:hypothetical protein
MVHHNAAALPHKMPCMHRRRCKKQNDDVISKKKTTCCNCQTQGERNIRTVRACVEGVHVGEHNEALVAVAACSSAWRRRVPSGRAPSPARVPNGDEAAPGDGARPEGTRLLHAEEHAANWRAERRLHAFPTFSWQRQILCVHEHLLHMCNAPNATGGEARSRKPAAHGSRQAKTSSKSKVRCARRGRRRRRRTRTRGVRRPRSAPPTSRARRACGGAAASAAAARPAHAAQPASGVTSWWHSLLRLSTGCPGINRRKFALLQRERSPHKRKTTTRKQKSQQAGRPDGAPWCRRDRPRCPPRRRRL